MDLLSVTFDPSVAILSDINMLWKGYVDATTIRNSSAYKCIHVLYVFHRRDKNKYEP